MTYDEAMKAARAERLKKSKLLDVPEIGGQLRFGPSLAGPSLNQQALVRSAAKDGAAMNSRVFALLLYAGCMAEDGSPFFKNEAEAMAFLDEISIDTMNKLIAQVNEVSVGVPPKGNSETSSSGG